MTGSSVESVRKENKHKTKICNSLNLSIVEKKKKNPQFLCCLTALDSRRSLHS